MWVHYSNTQRADGLFYLLKYDFSMTSEQFMDSIGNIKFEYASDYKPLDDPWFPRYPSSYAQQGQKQLGAYEGFINGCEFIVLEQMGFLLSKELRFLNDKFTEDKSIDLSTFNSHNVWNKNNYLHLASK